MPQGNDPTPAAELEAAFGVTSNASELIAVNRARYPLALREALNKPVDDQASADLDLAKVAEAAEVEQGAIHDAKVHGTGAKAAVVVVVENDRSSLDKIVVPLVEVSGSAASRRKAQQAAEEGRSPQEAADEVLAKAEADAREALTEAQAAINRANEEAAAEAQRIIQEASAEADAIRAKAAQDAQDAAEAAQQPAAKPARSK
ncbi:MAG TPA: hypothetical protein VK631_10525 [Solirubrobacteraceae bacterium]|nr:hypothetical protein [Solirubrobacteraceae bacterium]